MRGGNGVLAYAFGEVGEAQFVLGKAPAALVSEQQGLEIITRLATQNAESKKLKWSFAAGQRAMSQTQQQLTDFQGALDSAQKSLKIICELADAVPKNATWRHDLVSSLQRVGEVVKRALNDKMGALTNFQASLAIMRELVAWDASDRGWRENLTQTLNEVGDAQMAASGSSRGAAKLRRGPGQYQSPAVAESRRYPVPN